MSKTCSKCNIEKDAGEFRKDRGQCKACEVAYRQSRKAHTKVYNDSHREVIAARSAARYESHKGEKAVYNADYRESHKDSISVVSAVYYQNHKGESAVRSTTYKKTPQGKLNIKKHQNKRKIELVGIP